MYNNMRNGGLEPPRPKSLDPKSGQRASCVQLYEGDKDSQYYIRAGNGSESANNPATSAALLIGRALLPGALAVWS
jgi:hypothetical protein